MIQQNEQYLIEFDIKENNTTVTPTDIDDLRIQIGTVLKSYNAGELLYENQKWYYPITQSESVKLESVASVQVGIKKGDDIHYSNVIPVYVNASIIKKEW